MAAKLRKTLVFALLSYGAASTILFKYPHLKGRVESSRRDIKAGSKLLAGAHRCGSAEALENTVPAALKALKAGADIL